MKKILLSIIAIASFGFAQAQTPVSYTGSAYSQNFNTLDTATVVSSNLPAGWSIWEKGTGAAVDSKYKGGTGSSNTGDTYSFHSTGNSETALGSVASSGNIETYGVAISNNSTNTITSINVQYYVEQWRHAKDTLPNPIADSLLLEYSTTATGVNDSTASWTTSSIVATSPINIYNAAPVALDGNLSANRANVAGVITVTVPVGGKIILRFRDVKIANTFGNDGLAVDDLNLTFGTAAVPQPLIVSTNPVDNATGVAIGNATLTINFDKNLTIGTGNIYINNITDATQQTIAVSATSVAGMVATIPNVTLLGNKSYAVQLDSTCYKNGVVNGYGIYDNTTWNFQTINPRPLIVTKTPADNATNVAISTTTLSLDFDKNISMGTGNVTVKNLTDATNQAIAITTCTVSGMNLTIPGVTLLQGKNYAVQYDSTCVNASGNNAYGIYDTTTWNFSTVPSIAPPITSLNETFTGCLSPNFGLFMATSVTGAQTWRCSTYGHTDSSAVYMNGFGAGASNDNEDWLISPALNLSAMTNPMFNFWTKRRFAGTTTKEVYVSNNYTGDVTTATWTLLPVSGLATLDTLGWVALNNTSLTAYKSSTLNVAFKYVSQATGSSDEWTIDDVNVTEGPTSVNTVSLENLNIAVLGTVIDGNLNLMINNNNVSSNYTVRVTDMTGNIIYNSSLNVFSGKNKYSILLPQVSEGVYVLTIGNATSKGNIKFIKQ